MSEKLKCKIIKNSEGDIHYCGLGETPPAITNLRLEPDGVGIYRAYWSGQAISQIWIVFHQGDLENWTIEFGLDAGVHPVDITSWQYSGTGSPAACVGTSTSTKYSLQISNLAYNGNEGSWSLEGTAGAPSAKLTINVKRSGSALTCP